MSIRIGVVGASSPLNPDVVDRVRAVLDATLTPIGDFRGSKEYRLAVSKSLVQKFAWELGGLGRLG